MSSVSACDTACAEPPDAAMSGGKTGVHNCVWDVSVYVSHN
jgi:hypothetical protein